MIRAPPHYPPDLSIKKNEKIPLSAKSAGISSDAAMSRVVPERFAPWHLAPSTRRMDYHTCFLELSRSKPCSLLAKNSLFTFCSRSS